MLRRFSLFLSFFLTIYLIVVTNLVHANSLSIIRDTEVEDIIGKYATPVFRAARLEPGSIKLFILKNKSLNAFVADGQKIFIHSGLILESETADEIIGVIAHETGHIAGGHLSRRRDALSNFSMSNFLSFALGGAATIATKRGDLGNAIVGVGQTISQRTFFSYSRAQESSADHAALRYLKKSGNSATGLLKFMRRLESQDALNSTRATPYLRTHPLSKERIFSIKNHINDFVPSDVLLKKNKTESHARLKAKLFAFLRPPRTTLRFYKNQETKLASRYAQAIALHRQSKHIESQALIDKLIKDFPSDPYFLELKGQFLFEIGKGRESLIFLNKAINILPSAPLLRQFAAQVQLELNEPKLITPAIKNLKVALAAEPQSASSWYQLAIAYGRAGDQGNSWLALAEKELINGKLRNALYQARRAEKFFTKGSKEWIQANDIINTIEIKKTHKKHSKTQN